MANIEASQEVVNLPNPTRETHKIGRIDNMLDCNLAPTKRFLAVLTGDEAVTFQTFSDGDELKIKRPGQKDYDPNAGWRHGTLDGLEPHLKRLNAKGAGVYVMVNAGNGRGRSAENVRSVRALFIDTDGAPFPTDLPLQPHLVVQSSPGKYHLYWLVNGVELNDFGTLQQALAEHYGTDPSVKDLCRVMRLPGFYHRKGEPVMVQLLEASDHQPYIPDDVFTAWPFLAEWLEHERALEAEKEKRRAELMKAVAARRALTFQDDDRDRRRVLALLQAHHDRVANAGDGTRHETLKDSAYTLGGYVGGGHLGRDEVEDELTSAAETCGLPDGEAAEVILWGLAMGAEKPLELTTTNNTPTEAHVAFASGKRKRLAGWYK